MTDMNAAYWDNYWQGRASQQSVNALIEVGIENNHALNTFWSETFACRETSEAILDVACGAGSVLEHAHNAGFSNLTGVDVSQKALNIMKNRIPPAIGICSPVDNIPQAESSYNLIVSQFGIEYAGSREKLLEAFLEMHRLLKPSGEIKIIAHAKDGLIYKGCKASLKHSNTVKNSGFIEISKQILARIHDPQTDKRDADLKKYMSTLNEAAEPIMAWLRKANRERDEFARFVYYVLESSHKLITNHTAYIKLESFQWFSGIESELNAYQGRMSSMTKAALTEDEMSNLIREITEHQPDLKFYPAKEFYFSDTGKLSAWVIRAKKN